MGWARPYVLCGLHIENNAVMRTLPGLDVLDVVNGDVLILNQDLSRVSLPITQVYGSVSIHNSDLSGNPLKDLAQVGGGFSVVGGRMGGTSGRMALTDIGGPLTLDNDGNPSFEHLRSVGSLHLEDWSNRFNSLETVRAGVYIEGDSNGVRGSMSGFQNLRTIGGTLGIRTHGMTTISGFDALESVGRDLYLLRPDFVRTGPVLHTVSGFDSLTSVGGDLRVQGNALDEIRFLYGITHLGGILVLEEDGVSLCVMQDWADELAFETGYRGDVYLYGDEGCL